MTLPPNRWLLIALALVLGACAGAVETPRLEVAASDADASAFRTLVRRFPYRSPPLAASSGSVGEIAGAPAALPGARAAAPMALTASDGAGLEVTRLEARVVVDSMLAFTELRLSFLNPEARVREGRFTLQLPAGAAISRLAMKVNGNWQEAEVVERQQANRVYEDFLHQRQDPALLEKKAGNEFAARVFPIPPQSEKEIIVAYSEELGRQEYRLPLAGMPRIRELAVRAQVLDEPGRSVLLGPRTEHLIERDFVPDGDFRMALEKPFVALTTGQLLAIPVRWARPTSVEPIETLAIAFDTSASRALDLAADVKRLGELVLQLAKLHPKLTLVLWAFDQELRAVFSGNAKQFDPKLLGRVLADRALGASDLSIALDALNRSGSARVALFTDAVPTAGAVEPRLLAAELGSLEARGVRLDVIVSGAAHDRDIAEALVRGGGRVLSAELSAAELAQKLSLAPAGDVTLSLANADWIQPAVLKGLEPGELRTIHARLKQPLQGPLRVTLIGADRGSEAPAVSVIAEVLSIPSRAGERVLIERSVAGAEIRRVMGQLALPNLPARERASLKGTIVDLSRRYRVLSDYTALLVLETEGDYTRYGIDRNALTDIIGVGDRGLTRVDRPAPSAVGGQRLEQWTDEPLASRPAKALGPPRPSPSPPAGDGYGYEFSDDPLSWYGALDDGSDLEERCATDPAACPSADMGNVMLTGPLAGAPAVRGVKKRTCLSGPLRRWAAGVPKSQPCGPSPSEVPRDEESEALVEPYSGRFAEVMRLIVAGEVAEAQREALTWRDAEPLNTLALVALGEALEAGGKRRAAARAYGSLIDLYPSRADLGCLAAGRLERIGSAGLRLSEDSYRRALEQRPDHLTGHQLLAYSLLRQGRVSEAFAVFEGLAVSQGIQSQELREDVRLLGAVLIAREPQHAGRARSLLKGLGLSPQDGPTTRLILTWETDTNDVDLHLLDRDGEHASYAHLELPDGGALLTDVRTGYGPEEFVLAPDLAGTPYQLFVHYYSSGPMGFGMGKVDVVAHDGKGNVRFDTRPFVILNENGTVHLGRIDRSALP